MTLYLAPHATNSVGQIWSAADMNQLARLIGTVEVMSYREMQAFSTAGGWYQGAPTAWKDDEDDPNERVWRGFLRWRPGMTTLTITGRATGPTLFVKINGVTAGSSWVGGGSFSQTRSISSGYSDGQVLDVEIRMYNHSEGSDVWIQEVYASPLPYTATSWPGVPTFTTTIDAADINQLGEAATWLFNRMGNVPFYPFRGLMFQLGPFGNDARSVNGYTLWHGTVLRAYSSDRWWVNAGWHNPNTPGLWFDILFNGATIYSQQIPIAGYTPLFWNEAYTRIPVGQRGEVVLQARVTEAAPRPQWTRTLFNLYGVGTGQVSTTSYPYASVTAAYTPGQSLAGTALRDKFNSYATVLTNAKARIDAAPWVFDRVYALSHWFGRDNDDIAHKRSPVWFGRRGSRLIAGGKGVTLGYGMAKVPTEEGKVKYDEWAATNTMTLVEATANGSATTYLDSFEGFKRTHLAHVYGKEMTAVEEYV